MVPKQGHPALHALLILLTAGTYNYLNAFLCLLELLETTLNNLCDKWVASTSCTSSMSNLHHHPLQEPCIACIEVYLKIVCGTFVMQFDCSIFEMEYLGRIPKTNKTEKNTRKNLKSKENASLHTVDLRVELQFF